MASELDDRLMVAARKGDFAVDELLEAGADVMARDSSGATALDHALNHGHWVTARQLERRMVAQAVNASLFTSISFDEGDKLREVAKRNDLEARAPHGVSPLMFAARYFREDAMRTLLDLGAKVDADNGGRTALVYAVEQGYLVGVALLLERGASMNLVHDGENPVLVAACNRPDGEVLDELLGRGIDLTPFPKLEARSASGARLLREARAGRRPSWATCSSCRALPRVMGWCITARGESTGEPLPEVTRTFHDFFFVWKCPACSSYFEYEHQHDNGIPDGWDSEQLARITLEKALEEFRKRPGEARRDAEIAEITKRLGSAS